ncbi:hypothetical protein LGR88_08335 [Enterobacter cloacae]|uniref:hypothetical protein n=1 Tax=Enterobacter cloacae TaxID=550 RepID=UPI001F272CD0|nr:hypothetical protein [Enterobacter cloacae]MCF2228627.1 hypothetical protein [Enterobacter cloacae]MDV5404822.1 hypothetical protein [Enterobacter cloacae]
MKITVENISEMFEGTKELLIAGLITAITGLLILIRVNGYSVVKAPLMFVILFLITVLPGFISMLFSPMTKITAKIFDIKNSIAMCRIFSAIYFALYWFVTLLIVNLIVSSLIQMGNGDGGMKACFAIGCFVVAVVQTKRFYGLLIK